jgi:hypothetical protein
MYFETVAAISLTIEFVVISAIILTLLNAFSEGRLGAAIKRKTNRVGATLTAHRAAVPANQNEALPERRAA